MSCIFETFNSECCNTSYILLTILSLFIINELFQWYKRINYFKKLNIPSPFPMPFVSDFIKIIIQGFNTYDVKTIEKYGKVVGYFENNMPTILCTDLQMLRNVLIRDFNKFVNRRTIDAFNIEPLDKMITVLKDDEWKNVRSIVATAFASGKIKLMSKSMNESADAIVKHLEKKAEDGQPIDTKDIFSCFTLDTISTCCFGVETDPVNNPDSPFLKHLNTLFNPSILRNPRFLIVLFFPKFASVLAKWNLVRFISRKPLQFITDVMEEVIRRRKSGEEKRDDFVQMMLEHKESQEAEEHEKEGKQATKKNTKNDDDESQLVSGSWKSLKKTLTDAEILSQALLFFTAGFDTTSTTLGFVAYNLAMYPECQEKLYQEAQKAFQEHNDVNYDMVNDIPYLDMVLNETLRIYPPAIRVDRICNEDFTYKDIKIPKGSLFILPIWAIHHDPQLYPEPEKFIPERFDSDSRKERDTMAFIPFGAGPRNCIGLRFATIEMKLLLIKMILKFEFCKCEKTPEKLVFKKTSLLKPVDPLILKLKRRN